jgi:hypothetical protein
VRQPLRGLRHFAGLDPPEAQVVKGTGLSGVLVGERPSVCRWPYGTREDLHQRAFSARCSPLDSFFATFLSACTMRRCSSAAGHNSRAAFHRPALPLVRQGGGVVLWVGPSVDTGRVARVGEQVGGELAESRDGLLVLRKVRPTPQGFPLRTGVASKRPLDSVPRRRRRSTSTGGRPQERGSRPKSSQSSYLSRASSWSASSTTGMEAIDGRVPAGTNASPPCDGSR